MSTNPNNAVGTNAAYDGRTSVKAFNDGIGAYSRGILSGWACSPNTGMTVSLGGDGTTRDIAIAEDVAGNKTTINNISEAPISVTMGAAPSTNSRIDLIVAYVDNPPQGAATSIDNPGACGLIAVEGTAAADPVAPNDSAIRTAITADGASGSTAYYVVLATITVASGTTDLTSSNIAAGPSAGIGSQNIDFTTTEITTVTPSSSISATFHPDWYRKELGNGIVKYWLNFSFSVITTAETWSADRSVALPVTYDASKMAVSVSARAGDAAIITTPAFKDNDNYFSINRYNAFHSSITADVYVQAEITVFS